MWHFRNTVTKQIIKQGHIVSRARGKEKEGGEPKGTNIMLVCRAKDKGSKGQKEKYF